MCLTDEDEDAADESWLEELARRARRAITGEEPGELWSEAEPRLHNELSNRTDIL